MTYIIPTIHPAALLRGSKPISDVIRSDLAKANRISMEGPVQIENYVIVLPSNPAGLHESVHAALGWMDRWISLRCPVAVDIETSSLDFFNCKLYSVALAGDDGCNTAVAFTFPSLQTLPWDAAMALDSKFRQIMQHPGISKVYHNAPYDYAVLTLKGYEMGGPIEDTMAYHFLIQPDIPHDLGWVGHTYLDVEPWKLDHKGGGGKMAFTQDVTELLLYNAKDALNTMKLRQPLYNEVIERGMNAELISYQMAFAELAAQMEIVGVPINMEKRAAMGKELLTRLDLLKHRMREYLNWPDFNPMSKAHAVEALYNKKYVGLEATVFTEKTKQPSTKYETIIDHMEHPFVKDFIEFVENQHCYATQYRDESPDPKAPQAGAYRRAMRSDGRLHAHWSATGQKGSRFTSKPNIQNQRVRDRAFIETKPGRVFIGSDKDQLELRLAAALSGVRELVEEMGRPDGDPHRLAAINVYGDKFLSKSKAEQKRLRDAIKTTVYASLYRAGVKTVHKSIRKKKFLDPQLRAALTLKVVSHIYNSYFGKYVEIPAWHDHNYYLAQTQGYLEIPPLGRRRYFPIQPPPYTEVSNWPIQCEPAYSFIATSEGLLQVGDIAKTWKDGRGDVLMPDGAVAPAQLIPKGRADLIRVKLSANLRPAVVSLDHKWLCATQDRYEYKKACELKPGDRVCRPLPIGQRVVGQPVRGWPYWLGAMVSDDCMSKKGHPAVFFGPSKNRREPMLAWLFFEFACSRGWQINRPKEEKTDLLSVSFSRPHDDRNSVFSDLLDWGYDRDWDAYTKRAPKGVYTGGLWAAWQFIWGLVEGNGPMASSSSRHSASGDYAIYNLSLCNLPFLQDVAEISRYAGIDCAICGPFKADEQGPASWRLDWHAYDIESMFYPDRLETRSQPRCCKDELAPKEACEAFLSAVELSSYASKAPEATLFKHMKKGGSVAPWTLRRLYLQAFAPAPYDIFSTDTVQDLTVLTEPEPVYTFSVDHPKHQYISDGLISKNCLGSDIVTKEMVDINEELKRQKFKDAHLIVHGHDAVYIECYEKDAEAIKVIVDRLFGHSRVDGPAGPVFLTSQAKIGRNLKEVK